MSTGGMTFSVVCAMIGDEVTEDGVLAVVGVVCGVGDWTYEDDCL